MLPRRIPRHPAFLEEFIRRACFVRRERFLARREIDILWGDVDFDDDGDVEGDEFLDFLGLCRLFCGLRRCLRSRACHL